MNDEKTEVLRTALGFASDPTGKMWAGAGFHHCRVSKLGKPCSRRGIRPIDKRQIVPATSSSCMKILYIGGEQSDAQTIATALRGVDKDVAVSWASRPELAARWLEENREPAALVVETPTNGKSAASTSAPEDAERRHRTALAAAEQQLADLRAQYEIGMARATATWEMVDEQLRAAAIEVGRARQDQAAAAADVERHSQQASELTSQLATATATQRALEGRLAEAVAAVDAANVRTEEERRAAAEQLANRQREFDAQIAAESDRRRRIEALLAETVSARDDAESRHAAAAADVERLTRREADLSTTVADLTTSRNDFERRLAATEAAFEDASTRATRERLAASRKAAEREADLDAQIRQERTERAALEQTIADANAALLAAQEQYESAQAAAANELAERQAQFERELSQIAADRDGLTQQLHERELTIDQLLADHQSTCANVERLTQREAELSARLVDVQEARDILDQQLAEATSAITRASERATELEEEIRQERERCAALEQASADADAALRNAQQRHDVALAAAAGELLERETHLGHLLSEAQSERDRLAERLSETETTLDQARRDHEAMTADVERLTTCEATLTSQLADLQAVRDTLELQLAASARAIADADERIAHERAAATSREGEFEAQLTERTASLNALEQTIADTRSAALDAERALQKEVEALRAKGIEREAFFEVLLAQEQLEHESRLAELQAANRQLALEREALQQSTAATHEQMRQLRDKLTVTSQALDVTTRRADALQADAGQLPGLREQIEETRAENHRLFEQAGLAMFRCSPDGALVHANRAFATLVGRRTLDELRGGHFAASVFEAPDALSWLIERCVSTRSRESIETTWRRNDGSRLFVRLSARLLTSETIEVVVEDLTRLRVLQERLGQAHRMEAVGRFASEVAVTCGNLLNDIHQNGQEWLTTAGFDVHSRQQGELLLDEVRRAASFLQQLAAFGDEQARTPMLVDLNTLIRDLEPVLKRVAGDEVGIELRDSSSPLNVDVQTERVERLLVNLASYGRERMPLGGRLRIDLGTIVVDRHFAARYPNVRMGLHALITVTEIKAGARTDRAKRKRDGLASQDAPGRVAARSGVDFGTLQKLVSECGGHLWMKVHPVGEMVAKIRLPLASPPGKTLSRASVRPAIVAVRNTQA